jgi:FkbM family methyltransferase
MKVEKLISKNQPQNWFERITRECTEEYPIHLVDIDADEQVVDMGCNVGGFSQAFNYRFRNILAIDASSYNVELYKSRHSHTILHKAVSSKDGEIAKLKKYMGDGDDDTNSGNFSITGFVYENNKHGSRGDEYEEVETISLETIIEKVGDIGLLKIDIEGAEYDTLYKKDLSRVNYITGEFHTFLGIENQTKLFSWIGNTHNEIHSVGDGIGCHFLKLWKRK